MATLQYPAPGPVSSATVSLTFNGSANAGLAMQIANALYLASPSGTLSVSTYTGGTSVPVAASGSIQELVLSSTTSGSITVPAASSGAQQVIVITNTAPITIHGTPGLSVIGGGAGNVTIIDPASIVLADQGGSTNYQDLVSVPSADSPYLVGMRDGTETVFASGSGTIQGGAHGKDIINASGAGSGTSNVILTQTTQTGSAAGDTVLTGAGNTTVRSTGSNALIVDGTGTFTENDTGTNDTIQASAAATANVTTGGTSAVVIGGSDTLSVVNTGASNFIAAVSGTVSVTASATASGMVVFGGSGPLTVVDMGTSDTVAGTSGAMAETTGGSDALVYAGNVSSFTGEDTGTTNTIIGSNNSTNVTLAGTSGAFAALAGATSVVASGTGNLVFGGSNTMSVSAAGSTNLTVAGAPRARRSPPAPRRGWLRSARPATWTSWVGRTSPRWSATAWPTPCPPAVAGCCSWRVSRHHVGQLRRHRNHGHGHQCRRGRLRCDVVRCVGLLNHLLQRTGRRAVCRWCRERDAERGPVLESGPFLRRRRHVLAGGRQRERHNHRWDG